MSGYNLNSKPQTLDLLQNAFILISRFIHILYTFSLREKENVLEAAVFT